MERIDGGAARVLVRVGNEPQPPRPGQESGAVEDVISIGSVWTVMVFPIVSSVISVVCCFSVGLILRLP